MKFTHCLLRALHVVTLYQKVAITIIAAFLKFFTCLLHRNVSILKIQTIPKIRVQIKGKNSLEVIAFFAPLITFCAPVLEVFLHFTITNMIDNQNVR